MRKIGRWLLIPAGLRKKIAGLLDFRTGGTESPGKEKSAGI
jgi:hypothetical protein